MVDRATPTEGPLAGPVAGSPPASRVTTSRWRDPRLAVGLAVVAACTVLGSRLLASADDMVGVWAARGPVVEGQRLSAADLVRRQVRFEEQRDADRYLAATDALPAGAVAGRDVGAGELLPRAAVDEAGGSLTEVPLALDSDAVPATLRVGSTVDVWVSSTGRPAGPRAPGARARLVLDDVAVLAAPQTGSSLGPTATRQVIVGVPASGVRRLPTDLAALGSGEVLLTVRR